MWRWRCWKIFDAVIRNLLSGVTCLFIDGYEGCIAIDCRTYPARGVDEPAKDKSLRGSRTDSWRRLYSIRH